MNSCDRWVSLDFFSIADPCLGGIGHGSCDLLSFFLNLLLVPLLLKKPHFFSELKRPNIFEKVLNLLIMFILQLSVFIHV